MKDEKHTAPGKAGAAAMLVFAADTVKRKLMTLGIRQTLLKRRTTVSSTAATLVKSSKCKALGM